MNLDERELGTLARDGDQWTLTFTRRLAHPPEKVWRAVNPVYRDRFGPDASTIGPPPGWDATVAST